MKLVNNCKGFTMIEMLIALTVISLGLAASFQMFHGQSISIMREDARYQAALLAESLDAYFSMHSLPPTADSLQPLPADPAFSNFAGYQWKLTRQEAVSGMVLLKLSIFRGESLQMDFPFVRKSA
jgi:prepilin-type N-terminal cleavage/methylation domain-containing protein